MDWTQEQRQRLSDANGLRFKGEGNALSGALFTSYVVLLLGLIYGSITANYVFGQWPPLIEWVRRNPLLTLAIVIAFVLATAVGAFQIGRSRGPALPEPGFIEAVVRTDLPRSLTLRDSWRGSQIMLITLTFGVSVAAAVGLVMQHSSPVAIVAGVLIGLGGGVLIVQCWLRGQVRGHGPITTLHSGELLESLPVSDLLTQSIMSESVSSALVTGDTRRARTQAFNLRLGTWPRRIKPFGRYVTMVWADITGMLRAGWVTAAWVIFAIATVVAASLSPVVQAQKPLVLPVLYLLVHLSGSGLTRGLQAHGMSAGSQSIFGIDWPIETVLHLLPLSLLQLATALVTGFASGLSPASALYHAFGLAFAMAGGQLLYVHKGPPPTGMMGTAPGRGMSVVWMAHPAIIVIIAALIAHFGPGAALAAGAAVLLIGVSRAQSRFSPAKIKESLMEQATREQEERKKAKAAARAKRGR